MKSKISCRWSVASLVGSGSLHLSVLGQLKIGVENE